MKIDLHCHTKAVRSGELTTRNVSKEVFVSKLAEANVKIVAITNHDLFDRNQFEEFQLAAHSLCALWPGIEFNVSHDDEKYHMIIVGSPNKLDDFEIAVNVITSKKTGDFCVELDEIVYAFRDIEVLFLPHFGNKTPGISLEKLPKLHEKAQNKNRVILEDSNSRSTAILASHGMRTITGSDVKDWNEYERTDVSELRIPVDTFEQFCLFLERDPTVIKTLLDKNYSKNYIGRPNEQDDSVTVEVPLFREVNIIFGDKGTGKSQIIESVRKKMEADGLSVSTYISSKKDENINELIDSSDMVRSAAKLDIDECESVFQTIRSWGDEPIESVQTFIRHGETKHTAANKDRIQFIEQQVLPYDTNVLRRVESDLERVNSAINSIDSLEGHYLKDDENEALTNALTKLQSAILKKKNSELVEKYCCRLLEYTTHRIRTTIATKTGTVAKPTSTGFYDYAKNRLALHKSADQILQRVVPGTHKEHSALGNIGDKGDLYVESSWKMLDDDSRQHEYSGSPLISKLRDSLTNIKNIRKHAFSDDPQNHLDDFQKLYDEHGVARIGVFVGVCKYIVDNDMQRYTPSNGEKAIVMIQRKLAEASDAYLLDEPELSLGGTYIDKVIRPKISALGKAGKTVFIATHNANIAVRTLPYSTIYRSHDSSGYNTYLGNPFTNKLINIVSSSDTLDWKDVSMQLLEGGADAFEERSEIYEAGRTLS